MCLIKLIVTISLKPTLLTNSSFGQTEKYRFAVMGWPALTYFMAIKCCHSSEQRAYRLRLLLGGIIHRRPHGPIAACLTAEAGGRGVIAILHHAKHV
jgi:hypothetical protein